MATTGSSTIRDGASLLPGPSNHRLCELDLAFIAPQDLWIKGSWTEDAISPSPDTEVDAHQSIQ